MWMTKAADLRIQPMFDWLFGGLDADSTQNKVYSAAVVVGCPVDAAG